MALTETPSAAVVKTLTEKQARTLTDRIKKTGDDLFRLLDQARQGQAWSALGYDSWESYAAEEFNIGRSESYRLLDQARVVKELQRAASAGLPPESRARDTDSNGAAPAAVVVDGVSARAAADIKDDLPAVAAAVTEAVAGLPAEERPAAVAEVVEKARAAKKASTPRAPKITPITPQVGAEGLAEGIKAVVSVRPSVAARQRSVTEPILKLLESWVKDVRIARAAEGTGSKEVDSHFKSGKK